MGNKVFLHKHKFEVNISELSTLQVALDYRIEDYKEILKLCSPHDLKSRAIFEDKIEEMQNLKLKLEEI